jgi:hypothetical protein
MATAFVGAVSPDAVFMGALLERTDLRGLIDES